MPRNYKQQGSRTEGIRCHNNHCLHHRLHNLIKHQAGGRGRCFKADKQNKDIGTTQLDSWFGEVEN